MKNKQILLAMLVFALVLGMTFIGCKESASGNTDPKTIVITGLANSYKFGSIGLYLEGATEPSNSNLVAGAGYRNHDIIHDYDAHTITYPLYTPGNNTPRWKGNGTYDVYWQYTESSGEEDSTPAKTYKASSVLFNSATITIALSDFTIVP